MGDSAETIQEAACLLDDCALVERDDLARIRVTGADRLDYLHRMLTQDLKGLAPGAATYACLLTVKGSVLGDMLVWNCDDHLLLEMPAAARQAVMTPLERYVITDDVTFAAAPEEPRHMLVGPAVDRCLDGAGLPAPANGWSTSMEGGPTLLRFDLRGLPHVQIVGALSSLDLPRASRGAYDMARVHHCIPRFGEDIVDGVLFNVYGLEEAVSWNKGCYPGQEPVVMAKHRGRPPRRLVQLECDDYFGVVGSSLLHEGKAVGIVTSTAPALGDRPPAALGVLKHDLAVAGQQVEIDHHGGGVVRVVSGASE